MSAGPEETYYSLAAQHTFCEGSLCDRAPPEFLAVEPKSIAASRAVNGKFAVADS